MLKPSVFQPIAIVPSRQLLWTAFIFSTLVTILINIVFPSPLLLVLYAVPVILITLITMNLFVSTIINLILIIVCMLLDPGPFLWTTTIIPFIGYVLISFVVKQLVDTSMDNYRLRHEFESLFRDTIHAFSSTIDARDAYTANHCRNVAQYAQKTAKILNLSEKEIDNIYIAGILHDTGKIAIAENILNKQGRLTDEEFTAMKQHVNKGYEILSTVTHLEQLGILKSVLHHHERVDGQGYPMGLQGDSIPLGARILAVCDAFDAMTTDRSYRLKMRRDEAINQLLANKGSQFDPQIVDAFVTMLEREQVKFPVNPHHSFQI